MLEGLSRLRCLAARPRGDPGAPPVAWVGKLRQSPACLRATNAPTGARARRPPCLGGSDNYGGDQAIHVSYDYMSWSREGSGRRGYHHGNLREVLIRATRDLIAERGLAGFSFAEAARAAGVSSAAPYRHFRDKQALIADVARQGFERFATDLERAWNDGRPTPLAAIENVGRAHLAFAHNEPAYFSAMFEAGIALDSQPDLAQAAERAFAVLRKAAEAVCATLPKHSRPPVLMMSLHIWVLSHGIAALFGRGDAGRRKLPMSPEELLEAGILIYLGGLGLGEAPAGR
jgi:AcrR family transcriptional regulator